MTEKNFSYWRRKAEKLIGWRDTVRAYDAVACGLEHAYSEGRVDALREQEQAARSASIDAHALSDAHSGNVVCVCGGDSICVCGAYCE